jgi:hypothetical protein
MADDSKTELVYSSQKTAFIPGRRYANPRFFDGRVKSGVTKVIVVGNWPKVVAAYKAAGIPVQQIGDNPPPLAAPTERSTGPRKASGEVDIPADWSKLSWQDKRALVMQLTDYPAINSAEADKAIEAELARRQKAEATQPEPEAAEIPSGWRDLPWPAMRSLAASVSDTPIRSKADAVAAIEAAEG